MLLVQKKEISDLCRAITIIQCQCDIYQDLFPTREGLVDILIDVGKVWGGLIEVSAQKGVVGIPSKDGAVEPLKPHRLTT